MVALYNPVAEAGAVYQTSAGLTVQVRPFSLGAWAFDGGSITIPSAGTWYVGVDLFRRVALCLPRLGHRGWVPVARIVAGPSSLVSVVQIAPAIPPSRLPRTLKKIAAGQAISVLVMGSSLAEGAGTTQWAGMLFSGSSALANYKVPATIAFANVALGGTPNAYQLAQAGLASGYAAVDYSDSGYPLIVGAKTPPNGRSSLFTGVDLVVLTTLANGGDYRLSQIEPIVRTLRKMGVEVMLATDNPNAWDGTRDGLDAADLYRDGVEVMRVADLYGVELADTAAFVAEATLRYGAAAIYDTGSAIHMLAAAPAGRTATPSGGHEVWARAVRSCLTVDGSVIGTVVTGYAFGDGTTQGWGAVAPYGAVANVGSALQVSKTSGSTGNWAAEIALPALNSGDTVTVAGTLSIPVAYGGWPKLSVYKAAHLSNQYVFSSTGAFSVVLTATSAVADATLRFGATLDAAVSGSAFFLDDLVVTVNSTAAGATYETITDRPVEAKALPPSRVVTDLMTPGDAFVILPKDERHLGLGDANKGTLGASPLGTASFARRFSGAVGASEDLLTVASSKRAAISALGVVGFGIVYYAANGDGAVGFDVYKDNAFVKSMTIAAATVSREVYLPIYTPTQWANASANVANGTIDLRVTSGTLKIAALVALTFEVDFLAPEAARYIGTWTAKVAGGAPNMPGYGTDVSGDYAVVQCPPGARRLAWLCSSKPNSQAIDTWSGRSITAAQATTGVNHVKTRGHHVGPGEFHYIQVKANQPNADQATNGYGLHIGGMVVVNDR